jgi:hypothetical protein
MANKTLLNSVNDILKRVGIIAGDAGVLTSLTDSARQVHIDQAIQVINEGIDELLSTTSKPVATEQKEATVTILTGVRAYSLATDLSQLRWPLIDKTNGQLITEYPGGYNAMLLADMEQDDTGLPRFAAIRATDGKLHVDRAPTSAENGRVYTYQYDKDTVLSAAADEVPFLNPVYRAMVPAWVELWNRSARNTFDKDLFRIHIGRAARLATQGQASNTWSPR